MSAENRSNAPSIEEGLQSLRRNLGDRAELLAFLAEASRALTQSLDYRSTLRTVARLALPYLGGWSIVDLCREDGQMERAAIVHPDPEKERLARRLEKGWPPERDDPIGIPVVARSREGILVPFLSDEERRKLAGGENLEIIEKLGVRSVITVPLMARERVLGAMTFISGEDEHTFTDDDLRLADALGQRCALALDNALLYEEAQGRVEAEAGRKQVADILDRSLDGFVALDDELRFVYANQQAERIIGHPFQEIDGRTLAEMIPGAEGSSFIDELRRATLRSETVELEEYWPDRDRWYHAVGYPGDTGITLQFRDITERKRTEAELARAEGHYHRLVETSPYGIFVLNQDSCFTEVNLSMEGVLGRRMDELDEVAFAHLVPSDQSRRAARFFLRVLSGEWDGLEIELHLVRPDGEQRLCGVTATAIREGKAITGVYGVARDITDERARQVQLRRAERLASLGTLLSGVAHELDNPLTSIRGFAELLLLDDQSDSNREALEVIQREADRTSKIVSDLRLLARHTQDEPRGERAPVDLNDVVRHVHRIRRYFLETNNILLEQHLEEGLPTIMADRGQMEQILLNLVVNAEQALQRDSIDGATIRVRTRAQGDFTLLEVEDNGPGISEDSQEKIFDPFWSTRIAGGGSGLGLSLVHNLITEHGGSISVESEPGRGARFKVRLPSRVESAPRPTREAKSEERRGPSPKMRVLVVDDEESIRRLLMLYLERQGHVVDEAAEGGEALRLVEKAGPKGGYDVVLTDLRMPGMSGAQFFEELRARNAEYVRRVVFMTGEAASGDAARILAATGAPVLFKPVALKELLRVLEERVMNQTAMA